MNMYEIPYEFPTHAIIKKILFKQLFSLFESKYFKTVLLKIISLNINLKQHKHFKII